MIEAYMVAAAVIIGATLFLVGAMHANFARMLPFEPVPDKQDISRLAILSAVVERKGFMRVDAYSRPTVPERTITHLFKLAGSGIGLSITQFGYTILCNFGSLLEDGTFLETVDYSMPPSTTPKTLIQCAPSASFDETFDRHRRALEFLETRGKRARPINDIDMRAVIMAHETERWEKKRSFWRRLPGHLAAPYWRPAPCAQYRKTIEEQFNEGLVQL